MANRGGGVAINPLTKLLELKQLPTILGPEMPARKVAILVDAPA